MIKMLALDLDNTLLRSDKSISRYTEQILKKASNAGIKIVFATGRPYRAIRNYMEQVGCSSAVCHNGATAMVDGKRTDDCYCIPYEKAANLLKTLQIRYPGKKLSVEMNDRLYANFDAVSVWGNAPKDREILETASVQTDFTDLPGADADKILIEISGEDEYNEIMSLLPDGLYGLMSDGKTLCQVMNRNATKLNAVKRMAKRLGISMSEIAAFGDDYNDLEMIKYSGIGVAMGNAIEEVRRAADVITASNNEDGVARYISEHILNSTAAV